ncbi:MAG: hypothetical protein A3F40_02015 [Chlamydiae bacterium RIFCSPHIGHO2_12_FULL_27_8]|nr:MAG: hypothetical protein A3F40_02015 [Chlamydiae bacterium RIFCSPHIGHO2_12_FULL_27_8]OGN64819.1 MAG: hypothetical protein A2888_00835 [Chlamydiae bacterium RIFCSPLOWO2_01_FULL_28_7]
MKGEFLILSNKPDIDRNIYADKSSVILYWLLLVGKNKKLFSIREVAKECNLSLGLVQRVFKILTLKGYLQTIGIRTSKKFNLSNSKDLLKSWEDNYNIIEKCKIWTYRSPFQTKEKVFQTLIENKLEKKVVLALHSAAEACGYKNTNLNTIELYILEKDLRIEIEKKLLLEPQEKGYEIILIEPYYKTILDKFSKPCDKNILCSPILLTYLDLCQFPLRGEEQAIFILQRDKILKTFMK